MTRTVLLATFIEESNIPKYLTYLSNKFGIEKNELFFFKNLNDGKIIITFRFEIKQGERVDFKKLFRNTIIVHKKGNAIYTINALNKLIESDSNLNHGNINHKEYSINWDNYQNKVILLNHSGLVIYDIERIFL